MNKKEFFKSIGIFRDFSDNAVSMLAEAATENSCRAGEKIFSEGDPGKDLYIVTEGEVIISKKISPETEKTHAVLGPKSVVGETSLFYNVPRTADAKAKTGVKYYCLDHNDIQKIFSVDLVSTKKTLESFLFSTLERLEQTSRELATVYEISKIISESRGMKEFSQKVLTQISYSIPDIISGYMYVWNEFSEEFELTASVKSEYQPNMAKNHPLAQYLGANISETSIVENGPEIAAFLKEIRAEGSSMVIAPFNKDGLLLGFILLLSGTRDIKYGSRIRDLMNSISTQLVGVIMNIKTQEEELARERLKRARESSANL
jgi:CRP-like cAMP-binding protein